MLAGKGMTAPVARSWWRLSWVSGSLTLAQAALALLTLLWLGRLCGRETRDAGGQPHGEGITKEQIKIIGREVPAKLLMG